MGLDKLKSAFSNIEKMKMTDLSKLSSNFQSEPTHPKNDSVYNPSMPEISKFQSGPTHPNNDGQYNPEGIFELQPSKFQSGPTHPENDGIYNPISAKELSVKESIFNNITPQNFDPLSKKKSEFQSGPTHPENDGIYNPGMPKTSEFQTGPIGSGNDGIYNPVSMESKIGDSDFSKIGEIQVEDLLSLDTPILNEYQKFDFVNNNVGMYEMLYYDPRTGRPNFKQFITKNEYPGTKFDKLNFTGGGDSGIGGSFNREGVKYSLVFRNINAGTREEIINAGNYGQGTGIISQTAYANYNLAQTQEIKKYYQDGTINSSNSSWYMSGVPEGVTPPNENVTFDSFAPETRTVSLDGTAIKANELKDTGGWKLLYNADGSSKGVGYQYPNVDQSRLRYGATNTGFRGDEPYIRRDIGDTKFGTRTLPWEIGLEDVDRINKFMFSSQAGGMMFLKENILGIMAGTLGSQWRKKFNPIGMTGQALIAAITPYGVTGGPFGGMNLHRNELFELFDEEHGRNVDYYEYLAKRKYKRYQGYKPAKEDENPETKDWPKENVNRTIGKRDPMTLKPGDVDAGPTFEQPSLTDKTKNVKYDLEAEDTGMPMYFTDLRNGYRIYFRAFLEGLNINLSPSWNTVDYPGASQPVYSYGRTERDISFTLKMFAGSQTEFDQIYYKMNKLQQMTYPEYKADMDIYAFKMRQRPPFCEMRIGEMIGNGTKAQLGFIKSLNITVPEGSTWETQPGKRRPKYLTAAVSFQCINRGMPHFKTNFWAGS